MPDTSYDRDDMDRVLENVTPESIATDIMQSAHAADALKRSYAKLRQAKNLQEIERLAQRAPFIDLPNMIQQLAQNTTGAFLALSRMIERLEEGLDAGWSPDEDEGEGDEFDDPQLDATMLAEMRGRVDALVELLDYVGTLDGVPEKITKIVAMLQQDAMETREGLDEAEADIDSKAEETPTLEPPPAPEAAPTPKPEAAPEAETKPEPEPEPEHEEKKEQ